MATAIYFFTAKRDWTNQSSTRLTWGCLWQYLAECWPQGCSWLAAMYVPTVCRTIARSLLLELVRRGIQCMGGYNYLSACAAKLGSPLARQFRSCSEKTVWHGGAGWPDRPSRVCEKRSGTAVPLPASFASGKFIPTMLNFLRVQIIHFTR